MRLFDSHCHLHLSQFDADRAAVLARMQAEGVGAVLIGTDLATSRAAVALAEQHDFLWASIGLHPNDNPEEKFDIAAFEELALHPKVVAVGECGLDYFRSGGSDAERAAQKDRFLRQAALAEKTGKALVIHCRNAHEDMLALLAERNSAVPVVIHFFTGSGELAEQYLSLGCYLSFPGPVTYTDMYDASMRAAPLDRLLIETDAPFAAPIPYRGKRNEPAYVAEVAKKVALIKDISPDQVERASVANAARVFSLEV